MAYTLKKNTANKANYGSKRALSAIKWIVIHYTANDGDTDENNGKYFHNNAVSASANYFVDSDSITECVPDEYSAYAVGGSKYSTGGGKYYKKCTNSNSISIELCDDVKNGTVYPSTATIANAVAFTKKKMKEFGIDADHVIRHYDVNGKPCPGYWCGSSAKDKKWKEEFWNKLSGSSSQTVVEEKPQASKPSTQSGNISVDGLWGVDTTKKAQKVFGTTVDGKVSNQLSAYKASNPGLLSESWEWQSKKSGNSPLVKAIQKWCGATQDGLIGPDTIKKMQKKLRCGADGKFDKPSPAIKAFQKWLNKQ